MNKIYDRSLGSCFTLFNAVGPAVQANIWFTVIIGTYKDMTLTQIVPEYDCSIEESYYQRISDAYWAIHTGMKTKFKDKIVWDWMCNTNDVSILENVNNHLEVLTDANSEAGAFNMAEKRYVCTKEKWEARMAADPEFKSLINMFWYGSQA